MKEHCNVCPETKQHGNRAEADTHVPSSANRSKNVQLRSIQIPSARRPQAAGGLCRPPLSHASVSLLKADRLPVLQMHCLVL